MIILASTSPRRHDLLKQAGIEFTIITSDYEEDMTLPLPPEQLALHLAKGKAESVAKKHPQDIVIAADTFVVYNGEPLGKPKDINDAKRMLCMLSGKTHTVVTAFVICQGKREVAQAVTAKVKFKELSDRFIDEYSKTSMGFAGAYAMQSDPSPVESYEGERTTIMGLPMPQLLAALKKFAP